MKTELVLVVFGEELPKWWPESGRRYDAVIASEVLRQSIEAESLFFIPLEPLVGAGSIYEASALLEELSRLKFTDGPRISKSFLYEGYELWWIHYNSLFLNFCLPYTQYKRMLEHLQSFQHVHFYRPPHRSLFSCYLQAYGSKAVTLGESRKSPSFLPFGIFVQIVLTLLSLPILAMKRNRLMVYTGDKFEKDRDYDFRMRFVYEELRQGRIPFVEFIRGLESWRTTLQHAFFRKRPVVYSEAIVFIGRFMSILSGGHYHARQKFGAHIFASEIDLETRFKVSIATQYLLGVYDDIWAIRIMKFVLRVIGVKVAFVPSASERSFHTVLGCKLNRIPTIGIMHGVQIRYYNVYDFMPGFDGVNMLSVDTYGLWSEWWREYYLKNSSAYKPEQLHVSGPMRPLEVMEDTEVPLESKKGLVRVLFVAEQNAVPVEVIPYLHELLSCQDIELTIKFRPYRDGFEQWLLQYEPDILKRADLKIVKGNMQDAIKNVDVAVGCQSTGVLEMVLQLKFPLYFRTQKWGDYYNLKDYDEDHSFFAETPEDLIEKIQKVRSVSIEDLKNLRERFFGDSCKNGSRWVVEEAQKFL